MTQERDAVALKRRVVITRRQECRPPVSISTHRVSGRSRVVQDHSFASAFDDNVLSVPKLALSNRKADLIPQFFRAFARPVRTYERKERPWTAAAVLSQTQVGLQYEHRHSHCCVHVYCSTLEVERLTES
jgi:hypothetical protein